MIGKAGDSELHGCSATSATIANPGNPQSISEGIESTFEYELVRSLPGELAPKNEKRLLKK
jgi:hypothetical protein